MWGGENVMQSMLCYEYIGLQDSSYQLMHVFQVAFYFSGAYYALFVDQALLLPFFAVVLIYVLIASRLSGAKDISTRKKIMLASWSEPSEGVVTMRVPVRTERVNEVIHAQKETKLTLTHFALKAVSQLLVKQPDLNGKLVFGKWVPYDSVDISCLIDVEGGKDLAVVCIKGVDKMSVEDIASFIREKGTRMKKSSGGEEHKKRVGPLKLLPAFMVGAITEITTFIANRLGVSVPALGLERHSFGAATVTSLGMLGFEDAIAPFTGFANCTMFVSINASMKAPVIEGDKVVVGEVMNCNFAVDHRYIDGGKCKALIPAFRHIFEHPEEYMDAHLKARPQ